MSRIFALPACLALLALHGAAWAQIYETTDQRGNPVFSDRPSGPDARKVELEQPNIMDAPPGETPDHASGPSAGTSPPGHDSQHTLPSDENGHGGTAYEDYQQRQRAFEHAHPSAPHEVLDADTPTEVLDADAPHEIGDEDVPAEVPVDEAGEVIIHDSQQPPHRHIIHR